MKITSQNLLLEETIEITFHSSYSYINNTNLIWDNKCYWERSVWYAAIQFQEQVV